MLSRKQLNKTDMKQLKNLIFRMDSPVQRFNDNRELVLSVYFLAACVALVLTLSILEI